MFKLIGISALLAVALACAPAIAQTTPPPADQGPPPDAATGGSPPPGAATGGKSATKDLVAGCRSDAKAKGLKGDALKAAVNDCVGAQNPKAAARMECRQQGKAQGLSGDDMKAFIKTCVAKGPSPGGQSMAAPGADQAPPAGAAAAGAPPPGAAAGGKSATKDLVAGCRSDAKAKGLKGDALKAAVNDCVGAQNPKAAARLECRQQGKAKGLAGDDMKAFIKTCVAQGQQ